MNCYYTVHYLQVGLFPSPRKILDLVAPSITLQELREHLSLIEDIRNAEKDVMEVQERILIANEHLDRIDLRQRDVENYSLLCPRVIFDDYGTNVRKGGENTVIYLRRYRSQNILKWRGGEGLEKHSMSK